MNNLYEKTKGIMQKYNINANKRFGQNFLIDQQILDSIIKAGEVSKDDLVIEIGPGLGVLTAELCKNAGQVAAIEIDKRFAQILDEVLGNFNNYKIIQDDILRVKLDELVAGFNHSKKAKVIANLPYYITTPVIMKILEECSQISSVVVMVQKEVADRITARPGGKEYGALTVSASFYGTARKMFDVPPHCFMPRPDVTSSIIRIDVNEKPPVEIKSKESFFKVVKASFAQRRKTLLNSLANSGIFGLPKNEIVKMLGEIGIEESRRPETLTIEEFARIAEYMK
ncbi:MAG: 16S rRNA (adenine(1518)-N(6)/adenine(1519)-N(6))-dimethyltransferase RsmA [Deltaproteobacteria bacterium]